MKKFLINISIFIAIVAVVDISLGKTFYWLQSTKAKGRTQTEYYICNELNADILVMGSSRATHHYVAQMISDSLGKTCFNGGQDGNGIVLQYGRWKMISLLILLIPVTDCTHHRNRNYRMSRLSATCRAAFSRFSSLAAVMVIQVAREPIKICRVKVVTSMSEKETFME